MSKSNKNHLIRCEYFLWRLYMRRNVWYADGRGYTPNVGRHSLGTSDRQHANDRLQQLDRVCAENLGLVAPNTKTTSTPGLLTLGEGRRLYEGNLARPRVVGGVRNSTAKRYKAIFDKFFAFLASKATKCKLPRHAGRKEFQGRPTAFLPTLLLFHLRERRNTRTDADAVAWAYGKQDDPALLSPA